jgi:predicted ATP-dependent endonuclease of OLD family
MFIQRVTITNYRNFGNTPFTLELRPFTLVLGENNVGKTNLLNAVALLFGQDVAIAQRRILALDDVNFSTVAHFKKQVTDTDVDAGMITFPEVEVDAVLSDFDSNQECVVGDWFADSMLETARVTYRFAPRATFDRCKWIEEQRELLKPREAKAIAQPSGPADEIWKRIEFPIAEYRYSIYGGGVASNECAAYHLRMLRTEILDALRDARRELIAGGEQRLLYRVLRQGADTKYADLKERLSELERCVQTNQALVDLKKAVKALLDCVSLQTSPQENIIDFQFSSPDAAELLKKIGMIYGVDPVNVARNGLGRNNLLYLSLVLSQLTRASTPADDNYVAFRFVGVEEPEAHLHPHLQDHLARNIESIREAHDKAIQLVLTSHSTHIAAKLSLTNTVVLFQNNHGRLASHYILNGLDEVRHKDSIRFLSLYLDATKSRMFFAHRLILVEGIVEQVLIPRLFKIHHGGTKTLESVAATVVNVHGVAFRHFLTIVRNGYFRRCVVLTDQDSATKTTERADKLKTEFDANGLILVCITKHATFEKDLIDANKSGMGKDVLLKALKDTRPINGKALAEDTGAGDISVPKFFNEIKEHKAEFAFNLARLLDEPEPGLNVPDYVASAFRFLE